MLTMDLGLRPGEALVLRWSDIDIQSVIVSISSGLTQTRHDGITIKKTRTTRER